MSRVPIQLTFLFTSWVAAGAALHAASTDLLPQTPTDVSSLRTLDAQVREATRKALPAVVAISSLKGGSGVIISEDGLVLSQAHVTHGLRRHRVRPTELGPAGEQNHGDSPRWGPARGRLARGRHGVRPVADQDRPTGPVRVHAAGAPGRW